MSYYGGQQGAPTGMDSGRGDVRARSKSAAGDRQFTRDGRPILQFGKFEPFLNPFFDKNKIFELGGRDANCWEQTARALYMYRAAIPEELSFAKGDVLAVLRFQDDGWWEAEVRESTKGTRCGGVGLVPSNYLQRC